MRRRGIHAGETPVSPSLWRKIWSMISWIFTLVWKFILFIWYCFERLFLLIFLVFLTLSLAWWLSQKPSLYRDWEEVDKILPSITWSGDTVSIRNIRNHTWESETEFTPGYLDKSYSLADIESVYYSITPFSDKDGPAHTMLSFSFSGGQHLAISAELRKERGESFNAVAGVLNQFEIQYVISTEEDVVKLRTNYRKNQVYMYPIKTEKAKIQALFRSMLIRADKLVREPEFYNTLWNNCTTSILIHANALREEKLPWNSYTILPSHSDELVYGAGLIDTKLSLPDARAYYMISDLARNMGTGAVFSESIRKPIQ